MIKVRTLLKVGDEFIPIAEYSGVVANEYYIDGAIELELDGKALLSRDHWDLVDQLWAYLVEGLKAIRRGETFSTYFPDSPVRVVFRPELDRGTVTVEIDYRGIQGDTTATVGLDAFQAAMAREARQSFEALIRIAPGGREAYESVLRDLAVEDPKPLLELTADLRLTYDIGQEHSPVDPLGRTILVLDGRGRARLDQRGARRFPRAWQARIEPSALAELLDALRRAGFPAGSQRLFVPDAPIASLLVERAGTQGAVQLDRREAEDQPGYADALGILDCLAWQISGGETAPVHGPARAPGAVSEVEEVACS